MSRTDERLERDVTKTKVAINGLGRIGRATLALLAEQEDLELVAANDLVAPENLVYLLRYDTVYGRSPREVSHDGQTLRVGDRSLRLTQQREPSKLPWKELDVDIVFECTGAFTTQRDLTEHIRAGARRVILSAPAKDAEVATVVHRVNEADGGVDVRSCASCTTNCITPVVEVVARRIGLRKATMTTIHAYTVTQALVDGPASNYRRGRAAAQNWVPTSTGAAKATARALPQLKGRFDGIAVRGPVPVGSLADVVLLTERATSVDEINQIFIEEAESERYRGVLEVNHDPIVSSDVVGATAASIVDLTMTQVVDQDLVKILSWYDNERGYAAQMVREAAAMARH